MKRQDGFYWVLRSAAHMPEIAYFFKVGGCMQWVVAGNHAFMQDSDFVYIGPDRLEWPGYKNTGEFPQGKTALP